VRTPVAIRPAARKRVENVRFIGIVVLLQVNNTIEPPEWRT